MYNFSSEPMAKLNNTKDIEHVAKLILKICKIQENEILDDPNARDSIMKRAEKVLEGIDLSESITPQKETKIKDRVKHQAKELIAQIGRHSTFSLDGRDMRGEGRDKLYQSP